MNSAGISDASNEVSTTPKTIQLRPIGNLTIDEGKTLSFTAFLTDSTQSGVTFSLEKNPPAGAKIDRNTGLFTWSPSDTHGGKSYVFEIVAKKDTTSSRQTVAIFVNDIPVSTDTTKEPEPKPDSTKETDADADLGVASFVDKTKDPQYYVDRYNNEPTYKEWFDANYPEYSSIYEAVGLDKPLDVKDNADNIENTTKTTDSKLKEYGFCGTGTKLIDGVCTVINVPKVKPWWQFW